VVTRYHKLIIILVPIYFFALWVLGVTHILAWDTAIGGRFYFGVKSNTAASFKLTFGSGK
jgi:hypothetical protein